MPLCEVLYGLTGETTTSCTHRQSFQVTNKPASPLAIAAPAWATHLTAVDRVPLIQPPLVQHVLLASTGRLPFGSRGRGLKNARVQHLGAVVVPPSCAVLRGSSPIPDIGAAGAVARVMTVSAAGRMG